MVITRPLQARLAQLVLLLLLCISAPAADKKKGAVSPEIHPDMLVEIPGLEVVKAQKPCDNWAWWAAVQSIFEQQNLPLTQSYFVDRSDGGACLNDDHPLNLYDVASSLAGDYSLPNGRAFHCEVALGKTAVPIPTIVSALRDGRPMLIVWQKRPYIIQGVLFDDRAYSNGQHSFLGKELHLINPADAKPVKLALDDDSLTDITGVMDAVVTELKR
jgi:hypothetical protein